MARKPHVTHSGGRLSFFVEAHRPWELPVFLLCSFFLPLAVLYTAGQLALHDQALYSARSRRRHLLGVLVLACCTPFPPLTIVFVTSEATNTSIGIPITNFHAA
jgi:hypothetical protein